MLLFIILINVIMIITVYFLLQTHFSEVHDSGKGYCNPKRKFGKTNHFAW